MKLKGTYVSLVGLAIALSPILASATTNLTASCVGVPAISSVTWTAGSTGGIAPIAFLWGNNATSSVQTVAVTPGAYTMTLRATDASSTVATTTCSATVADPTGTGSDIQTQIQNLLNQIASLRAQILQLLQQADNNATSTPPIISGSCLNLNRDLSRGDEGDDVRELQQNLAKDPSVFPEDNITGFFGDQTEKAVERFQEKHGIFSVGSTTTGFFGPRTRGYLKEHCNDGHESEDRNATTTPDSIHSMNHGNNENRGGNSENSHDN